MADNNNQNTTGILTISLDFELYWGIRELVSLEDKAVLQRLKGVYQAVPAILNLFKEYNIQATWAIVGFMYFQDSQELQANLPTKLPKYEKTELSPYQELENPNPATNPYKFCPELIKQIQQCPGQEIATHTFSHYYCLEAGQTQAEFKADLQAAIETAKQANIKTESLVFPRNQYNEEYLATISELGLTNYRGNEENWLHDWDNGKGNKIERRLLRLADAYFPITGRNCYSFEQLKSNYPVNIPASRFLRPYSAALKSLEPLKLKRITSELDYAAQEGLIYHLWWHPHNFGVDLEKNLNFLQKILEHYQGLNKKYNMHSLNMGEVANATFKNYSRIYKWVKTPAQRV